MFPCCNTVTYFSFLSIIRRMHPRSSRFDRRLLFLPVNRYNRSVHDVDPDTRGKLPTIFPAVSAGERYHSIAQIVVIIVVRQTVGRYQCEIREFYEIATKKKINPWNLEQRRKWTTFLIFLNSLKKRKQKSEKEFRNTYRSLQFGIGKSCRLKIHIRISSLVRKLRFYPRASSSTNATPQSEAPTTTIFESTVLLSIMDNLGVVKKSEKDSVSFLGFLSVSIKLRYRYFILRRGYTGIIMVKHIARGCLRVWKRRWRVFSFILIKPRDFMLSISNFFPFLPACSTSSPRVDSKRRKSRWAVKSRW